MKLIAIETATGKQFPVREAGETWILVQTGKQSYVYEQVGEHYTLHISTCMFDQHGREILVGDSLRNNSDSVSCPVYYTGTGFLVPMGSMDFLLTPEIAATMEVTE